jgi:hypothetical protein
VFHDRASIKGILLSVRFGGISVDEVIMVVIVEEADGMGIIGGNRGVGGAEGGRGEGGEIRVVVDAWGVGGEAGVFREDTEGSSEDTGTDDVSVTLFFVGVVTGLNAPDNQAGLEGLDREDMGLA